jgi:hypothetical protein
MKNRLITCAVAVSLLMNFVLALFLVWANTQRAELAYGLSRKQKEMMEMTDIYARREIMRDKLFSPVQLERKASGLGLNSARPGQKRFINQAQW